ncbi:MAG: M42 family metallopeptidase [Oscillospiraceae bacterium]|nr:M42 family metallopeptidase [Oscillospiraceae bacterium]
MTILDTMETLCCLEGVSGSEDEVRAYILERAMPFADELLTDPMGNLMIFKKGVTAPRQRVMLCAHMDEVGLMVTAVTEEGYLRFDACGGIDRRVLIGKRVFVGPMRTKGVVGSKAIHLTTPEQRKTLPRLADMYIDIGAADKASAEALVSVGDTVAFDDAVIRFGDGFIKAKAIDDRAGCAVMLELIESQLPCDCWFAFTVQEEVGCRGAAVAARRIQPETALILEATTAADIPGVEGPARVCALGQGVVIPFMDRGTIYDKTLCAALSRLAEENNTPWQTKTRIAGGTDASAVQRSGTGVQVAALSVPVRNIHSPACVAKIQECENQYRLARLFLQEMGREPA